MVFFMLPSRVLSIGSSSSPITHRPAGSENLPYGLRPRIHAEYKLATDDLSQLLEDRNLNRLNYAFKRPALFRMEDYENAQRLIREDQPFQEASRQSETSGDPGLTLTRLRGRLLLRRPISR